VVETREAQQQERIVAKKGDLKRGARRTSPRKKKKQGLLYVSSKERKGDGVTARKPASATLRPSPAKPKPPVTTLTTTKKPFSVTEIRRGLGKESPASSHRTKQKSTVD